MWMAVNPSGGLSAFLRRYISVSSSHPVMPADCGRNSQTKAWINTYPNSGDVKTPPKTVGPDMPKYLFISGNNIDQYFVFKNHV